MPLTLSHVEQSLKGSPIRRIARLLAQAKNDPHIISFGGGAPSLEPPKAVVDAMTRALKDKTFQSFSYSATQGSAKLRNLVMQDLRTSGLKGTAENIAITTGSTGGIFLALEDLLNPKDEVLMTDPTYVGYPGPTIMDRARVKRIPTFRKTDFQLTADAVRKKITKKTKVLLLLTPDNPTGRLLSKENLKALAELAVEKNFWLVVDETYRDLVYEGRHISAGKFASDNTITIGSFSKSASMPGLRLGWIHGPLDAVDGIAKLNQYVTLAPNTLSQIGAEAYYKVKDRYVKNTVIPTYKKKRDVMTAALETHLPKAKFVKPHSALYHFLDMHAYAKDDNKLTQDLLAKKRVVIIPGKFFGNSGKGHVRFTFVTESEKRIWEGVKRVGAFVKERKSI